MAASKAVSSEAHVGEVGGRTSIVVATFTRPANTTAYANGDLVANDATAGNVAPMSFSVARIAGGSGMVRRARLRTNRTGLSAATPPANGSFRLHLYRASPTAANGDNGAWFTNQADDYLGAIDITLDKAFSDGASGNGVPNVGAEINFDLPNGQSVVYGLLEARAAYTPASGEAFTVELEVLQN